MAAATKNGITTAQQTPSTMRSSTSASTSARTSVKVAGEHGSDVVLECGRPGDEGAAKTRGGQGAAKGRRGFRGAIEVE